MQLERVDGGRQSLGPQGRRQGGAHPREELQVRDRGDRQPQNSQPSKRRRVHRGVLCGKGAETLDGARVFAWRTIDSVIVINVLEKKKKKFTVFFLKKINY